MTTQKKRRNKKIIRDLLNRLVVPTLLLAGIFFFGTLGYLWIGWGEWTLLDSAYMTSITLTTVGYGEVLEGMGSGARFFTMFLMWSGMGVTLYAVSAVTAFVVEKHLSRFFRERKMEKRIAALENHVILCGAGTTGRHIINELLVTETPCCVVDFDAEVVKELQERYEDLAILQGDATEEETLLQAGIERSGGLIANLNEDSRNILITVMARFLRSDIKIVVRAHDPSLADKFRRAGADYVVNPSFIGGMRLASEMIRPHVVTFLDRMLRGQDPSTRFQEVIVEAGSTLEGTTLEEADIFQRTGLSPMALLYPETDQFVYNPAPDSILSEGVALIVIGKPEQLSVLAKLCGGS